MEAFVMETAMTYMVVLEDGELVKMTDVGFEATGMYVIPVGHTPVTCQTVSRNAQARAHA
jgi:hypothetical protein